MADRPLLLAVLGFLASVALAGAQEQSSIGRDKGKPTPVPILQPKPDPPLREGDHPPAPTARRKGSAAASGSQGAPRQKRATPSTTGPPGLKTELSSGGSTAALTADQVRQVGLATAIQRRVDLVNEIDSVKAGQWLESTVHSINESPTVKIPGLVSDVLGGVAGGVSARGTPAAIGRNVRDARAGRRDPRTGLIDSEPMTESPSDSDSDANSSLASRARAVVHDAKRLGYDTPSQLRPAGPTLRDRNTPSADFDPLRDLRPKLLQDIEKLTSELESTRGTSSNIRGPSSSSATSSSGVQTIHGLEQSVPQQPTHSGGYYPRPVQVSPDGRLRAVLTWTSKDAGGVYPQFTGKWVVYDDANGGSKIGEFANVTPLNGGKLRVLVEPGQNAMFTPDRKPRAPRYSTLDAASLVPTKPLLPITSTATTLTESGAGEGVGGIRSGTIQGYDDTPGVKTRAQSYRDSAVQVSPPSPPPAQGLLVKVGQTGLWIVNDAETLHSCRVELTGVGVDLGALNSKETRPIAYSDFVGLGGSGRARATERLVVSCAGQAIRVRMQPVNR